MKYIQIDTEAEGCQLEQITGLLLSEGITDTVVTDPHDIEDLMDKKNDYDWDYIDPKVLETEQTVPKITFYLEDDQQGRLRAQEITEKIKSVFPNVRIFVTTEDDSSWKDEWKKYFKPARITDKLTVKPTWHQYLPDENELIIEIDPGMAFGTGTHETTSLCMKLMEKYIKEGDAVLDVGCGSGILSIGAALLGAGEVLAVDIDPEAVEVSKENVAKNGCRDKVSVKIGNLAEGLDFKADMVLANLMADLVMNLSRHVGKVLRKDGIYISSGILTEKKEQVAAVIEECGFEIKEIREDGMWCAIAAVMKEEAV